MAMDYDVQRLELGDVVLVDLDDQAGRVEAKVQSINRNDTTVRVTLRVDGRREDFVREWRLGERVTVVRGP
jgi:hypothetical protein